ncbi:alpha/beta fold hydrolase [Mycolicibacterium sp. 120270]|uniref:alpha/beta fold hydrolase n=1 Tax=Mycolicibacterium sp. 120270 TaxID=3090600 RepID=UPI00299D0443|nr:alpha/beta fold hydrolase [Mycolicibacterium sp. 120270]MDX1886459.1 alpha/beta fold hydrolase [Mycolicibacterium sp. 120270]
MTAPIVFLHPLGADGRFWDPVLTALGSSAVAFDLPGHGSAPLPPLGATIDAYSAPVATQIAALGEPAHLVGMSLGGLVAQHLGATRPDLAASVVLADTVPVYPEPMRQMWRERAQTARTSGLASLVDPMVEMWFTAELAQRDDPRVQQARRTFAATDPEGYARTCEVLADVDVRDRVGALAVPATVVCGEDDAPPFRDAAHWLADATGSTVQWLPGKHACAVEHPERFAELAAKTAV